MKSSICPIPKMKNLRAFQFCLLVIVLCTISEVLPLSLSSRTESNEIYQNSEENVHFQSEETKRLFEQQKKVKPEKLPLLMELLYDELSMGSLSEEMGASDPKHQVITQDKPKNSVLLRGWMPTEISSK